MTQELEGNGVIRVKPCAGWPVAGWRGGGAEDDEGTCETELEPIVVFIMNDRNCHAALGVGGAPVTPHHNDPHLSAERVVKYIVQEMAVEVGFHLTEKNLIRRGTGPPPTYDYWCVHSLQPKQAKLFEDRLEDFFTTGPPGQPPAAQTRCSQWSLAVERNGHNPIGAVYKFCGPESFILRCLFARGAFRP